MDLLNYCENETQHKIITLHLQNYSGSQIANQLGKSKSSVNEMIHRIKTKANNDLPGPTLYKTDEDGTKREILQWVKPKQQDTTHYDVLEGFKDEITPTSPVTQLTTPNRNDLLNCYVLTDAHIGMLSWDEECGQNYDTSIAEQKIVQFFQQGIQSAPQADTAVFAQLGDFLHYDSFDSVTPANQHVLDSDTRFHNLVRVAIRVIRQVTRLLLQKYNSVHFIMAEGNHDPRASVWLKEMFYTMYQNEPRITVDTSPNPYHAYQWGSTSLFFNHGHLKKFGNIDQVFVSQFREIYGMSNYSFGHTGHKHHEIKIETPLMVLEQHPTIANASSYEARHGFLSVPKANVITYSKTAGEVGRVTISSAILQTNP